MRLLLNHIESVLAQHHRTSAQVMADAVEERLAKSLTTYEKELDDGVTYVANKSEINVLKKL